jgi:flagellar biosynthesis protein FlhA
LPGTATTEPAFGLPAVWIDEAMRDQAQTQGYTVVDAATVVATHLNHLIQTHAAELLGRSEVQNLLDRMQKDSAKLIEDLIPKVIPVGVLQRVLQSLLEEGVHIRDMRTILESVAEHAAHTQDPQELTAQVRIALGRAIAQSVTASGSELQVIALGADLEKLLMQALASGSAAAPGIEPGIADAITTEAASAVARMENLGATPVLLTIPQLRAPLSRFLRRSIPHLKVVAHTEIPDNRKIRITAVLGGRT